MGCGFRDERSGELKDIMSDAEALGNFSRSAALAVFSGDTSSAVDAHIDGLMPLILTIPEQHPRTKRRAWPKSPPCSNLRV